MKFRTKAAVQRLIARLPAPLANEAYYFIQRRWGRLQRVDPLPYFEQALQLAKFSWNHWPKSGPVVLEVGTGRTVNVPFALWLAGASRIVSFDLNRYLRPELVMESIAACRRNQSQVFALFNRYEIPLSRERWETLLACSTADEALTAAQIEYQAPADASSTAFPAASIDLHISVNVLEHVPPVTLADIFAEARRLLRPHGRIVHKVDPSDHFYHTDPALNAIHFLRYSHAQWTRIAGNQFMYQNRLRSSEYVSLLEKAGFYIERKTEEHDIGALEALKNGFPVHPDFLRHSNDDLATTALIFAARIA